jgi:hypothetical protein
MAARAWILVLMMAGCSSAATEQGNPVDAGAQGSAPPPGSSGGSPLPQAQVSFDPSDGTTAVGPRPLVVSVYEMGFNADEAVLRDLAGRVSLRTWPEGTAVPADATINAGNKTVSLTPTAAHQDRWYLLAASSLPDRLVFWSRLPDGTIGARFRPGSHPRVSHVQFCEKEGAGMKLVVNFSEPMVARPSAAGVVSLEIEGKAAPCALYDPREDGLYFTCDGLRPTATVKVAVSDGLPSKTGVPLAPGAWTIDIAKLLAGSCRDFRTPL